MGGLCQDELAQFHEFMQELSDVMPSANCAQRQPIMLDIFSGANAPLAKAFLWCQWLIITPIDLEVDPELDVSRVDVRKAIHARLPNVALISGAMSCATKSRAREKAPGPPPLRSEEAPRGLGPGRQLLQ